MRWLNYCITDDLDDDDDDDDMCVCVCVCVYVYVYVFNTKCINSLTHIRKVNASTCTTQLIG